MYTHGSVHRYALLNTDEEIRTHRDRNADTLVDYFQKHGVVVIGYSGWEDATMAALSKVPCFDGHLYWCDIKPPEGAQKELRADVRDLLSDPSRNAYYVQIPNADDAMSALHRELDLGALPAFVRDPLGQLIQQLESLDVEMGNSSSELIDYFIKRSGAKAGAGK